MKLLRLAAVLLCLPAALRAGGPPAWPGLGEQLSGVKPGSALEALIRANQDFSLLGEDERDDRLGLPPWLRVWWRKAHPRIGAAADPTKGYPLALREIGAWMRAHPDLQPPEAPAGRRGALEATVGGNVSVSGTQGAPRSESDVRISPADPTKVLAASNDIEQGGRLGTYVSTDAGATWFRTALPLQAPDTLHSDPSVDWTSDGTAWAATLGISGGTLRVRTYRSTDSGLTWAFESTPSGSQTLADKELIWADHAAGSPYRDRIHAIWHDGPQVFVNRRTAGSGGAWLAAPLQVSGAETAGTGIGADVKTNGAGDVFAFWPDTGAGTARIFVAKSTSGGDSWGAPVPVAVTKGSFTIGVPAMASRRALVYTSSGAFRLGGRDEAYVSFTDLSGAAACTVPSDEPGPNAASPCTTRVFFARSTDGGATWGAPAAVSDDGGKHDQFNQALAVDDATGQLALVYEDTAGDPARLKADVFFQSSFDGGLSWTCPVKLTTASTDETGGGADLGNQYGDYNGLSGRASTFFPSFTDRRSGGFEEIWTAKVTTAPEPGPPSTGAISVPGNNQIQVTWGAGSPAPAGGYAVRRAVGACAAPGPFARVATAAASPFVDTLVSGGVTYAYEIASLDANGCEVAPPTACLSASATGGCRLPPGFAGVGTVTAPAGATCTLHLTWSAATPACSGPLAYDVYRSTVSGFDPSPANRVAAEVPGTSWDDAAGLVSGTRYFYVVRAVDLGVGMEETNSVELSGVPTGPLVPQAFAETFEGSLSGGGFDHAGWTHAAPAGGVDWAWSAAQSISPSHSWFSQSRNVLSDRVLASPVFAPTGASRLVFWHTYAFEGPTSQCFDGGLLEASTDGGATWSPVPPGAILSGGYNGIIATGWDNVLSGRPAWCGGTLGAMTQVVVNLGGYAGRTIRIRWHEGDDRDGVGIGWYVDSVSITNASFSSACATGNPGLKLYTLAPCRVADTRNPAGPLGGPSLAGGAAVRSFALAGTCGVPGDAKALSLNVTAIGLAAPGDLRLFAAGTPAPPTSVVNFRAGQNRANDAVVAVSADGTASLSVENDAAGPADLVLDVNGFFR